jgi:hypothetical protein
VLRPQLGGDVGIGRHIDTTCLITASGNVERGLYIPTHTKSKAR